MSGGLKRHWHSGAAALAALTLAASAAAAEPEIRFGGGLDSAFKNAGVPPESVPGPAREAADPAQPPRGPAPRVVPHAGLDVGGSAASLDTLSRPTPNGVQGNYDPDRRYKAKAGLDYQATPKVQLGFDYLYSNAEHPSPVLAPAPDTDLESQERNQAARFSLRYKFGEP